MAGKTEKGIASFFTGLIQDLGRQTLNKRMNEKARKDKNLQRVLDFTFKKYADPKTPYEERIKARDTYETLTGTKTTPDPEEIGRQVRPWEADYMLPTPEPVEDEDKDRLPALDIGDYFKGIKSDEKHEAELAGVKARTEASKSLTGEREARTAKIKRETGLLGPDVEDLDKKLKTKLKHLNDQYRNIISRRKTMIDKLTGRPKDQEKYDVLTAELKSIEKEYNDIYKKEYPKTNKKQKKSGYEIHSTQ